MLAILSAVGPRLIHWIVRTTLRNTAARRAPALRCCVRFLAERRLEDVFDPGLEKTRDAESKSEARMVLAPLQCIHGLPRDFELLGEVSLSPLALRTEVLQSIGHHGFARGRLATFQVQN